MDSNNIKVPLYQKLAKVLLELYIFIGIICLIVGIFITIYGNIKKTSENLLNSAGSQITSQDDDNCMIVVRKKFLNI